MVGTSACCVCADRGVAAASLVLSGKDLVDTDLVKRGGVFSDFFFFFKVLPQGIYLTSFIK